MQATPATAGQLPSKVRERVQQLIAAGLDLPKGKKNQLATLVEALAQQLEDAEDTIRTLHERVEELEDFKDKVDDHNEKILGKAYDVVDTCHHTNHMDWISKAMKHVLMRDEFLTQEKRNLVTECTREPQRQSATISHYGSPYMQSIQTMVDNVNAINYVRDDISLLLVEQMLKDLPALIKVNQQVSNEPDGTTYISVRLDPKVWNIRADKKFYLPVDYGQDSRYSDYRY